MKTTLLNVLVIAALAAGGCKKDEGKKPEKKPTAGKTTQDTKPAPEPKKWTAADTMKRVDECTAFWNSGDMDKVASCYGDSGKVTMVDHVPPMEYTGQAEIAKSLKEWRPAVPDSKMEPQLVLVNGNNYAVIALNTGTNSGEFMGMPATNKKLSSFGAVIGIVDDKGTIVSERHLGDQSTIMHQLGIAPNPMAPDAETAWPDTVRATATASETETANVAAAKKTYEAISAKDTKTFGEMLADDASFRWVPMKQTAEGKEAYVKGLEMYLSGAETIQKTVKEAWGAGDWVVTVVETTAKLAGDVPGFKGTKGKEYTTTQFEFFRFADGKIKQHWVFDNTTAMLADIGAIDPAKMMPGGDKAGGATAGDKPKKK